MTIKPTGDHILIKLDEVKKVGDLDISSKKTINEFATVLAIGPDVKTVKVGDKIFVKGWGIDSFTKDKEKFDFVAESTNAVCGIAME